MEIEVKVDGDEVVEEVFREAGASTSKAAMTPSLDAGAEAQSCRPSADEKHWVSAALGPMT